MEEQLTIERQAIIRAESKFDVKTIDLKKAIELKENEKKMAFIEADMVYEKAKTEIETEFLASF